MSKLNAFLAAGAACAVLGACGEAPSPMQYDSGPPPVQPVAIPADSLFRPISEQSFTVAPPAGPPAQCDPREPTAGCWYRYDPNGNFAQDTAADAPFSPPGVLRIRFPAGLAPGYSPGLIQGWSTVDESLGKPYMAIRESGWVRVPTPSFEMQKAGVKFLGYVGVGRRQVDGIPSQILFWSDTPAGTGPWTAVNLNLIQQAYQERKLPQNVVTQPLFTFGTWHNYEYLMVLNDLGESNGRLRMWMDGQLIMDYFDVEFRTPDNPAGFYGRRWDPIWGGAGGGPHQRDDWLEIDHLEIRGVPMPGDTAGLPPDTTGVVR